MGERREKSGANSGGTVLPSLAYFCTPVGAVKACVARACGAALLASRLRRACELVEQLCDTFDAYCAVFPESRAELEDFLLLYRAVVLRRSLVQETCRRCHCLILVDAAGFVRECGHCNPNA